MESVRFHAFDDVREAAEAAFRAHAERLAQLLPFAFIEHVGGTTLPGVRTKGDLDIQARVPQDRFFEAEAILAARYERNLGSTRNDVFAAFKDDSLVVPLGIQLTAIDSENDCFVRARQLLRGSPELAAEYDALKARFEGQPMADYRKAKAAFFARLLG
jgi:GrpB-like predicted nucleotidyltransferase (UPF0157 family)